MREQKEGRRGLECHFALFRNRPQMRRTYYDGSGQVHLTLTGRRRLDRTRTFTLSVLNRAFTLFGFSPQLALINEARQTNAQAQDYDRNRAELRFVRQF